MSSKWVPASLNVLFNKYDGVLAIGDGECSEAGLSARVCSPKSSLPHPCPSPDAAHLTRQQQSESVDVRGLVANAARSASDIPLNDHLQKLA
jgi:hypothetical protein